MDDDWLDEDDWTPAEDFVAKESSPRLVEAIGRHHHIYGNRHRSGWKTFLKRCKARSERRRARLDPGANPGYGRYRGWGW